jgi:hypothetical protein
MTRRALSAALLLSSLACASQHPRPPASPCAGATGKPQQINEPTVGTLSDLSVGVSNILERDLPDDKGVVNPRVSAHLSIWDPTNEQDGNEATVIPGHIVPIGADRYCVEAVEMPRTRPGWIILRKL